MAIKPRIEPKLTTGASSPEWANQYVKDLVMQLLGQGLSLDAIKSKLQTMLKQAQDTASTATSSVATATAGSASTVTQKTQTAPSQSAPNGARVNTAKGAFIKTAKGWANAANNQPVGGAWPQYLNKQYFASLAKFNTRESKEPFVVDLLNKKVIPLWEWNLGRLFKGKPTPAPAAPAAPGPTKPITLKQPTLGTPSKTASAAPSTTGAAKPQAQQPFTMQVDIKGQTVKVTKVEPSAKAPAGWYYWHPEYKTWVYPAKDSQDAKVFDQYYAAKTMNEETSSEIDTKLDHLGAARQAEQQGDKALQYEKLADYHTEFSKINKLKPADRVHHTTQAGIYRSAAQAVRSAQETLAKSSK